MTEIYKASAGAGKTYQLSHTYMARLMAGTDEFPYRHILAVTFTNKATAEMKQRILDDLKKMADAGDSRARRFLIDILHDYSAFSVSTIDRFFQKILKSFSREIGYFASYQIELDRDSLIKESADRILDSLTEDKKELVGWIKQSVTEALGEGKKPDLDTILLDTGRQIKSENHRRLVEACGIDESRTHGKERLRELGKACNEAMELYVNEVCRAAQDVADAIESNGLDADKTSRKWLTRIYHFTDKAFVREGKAPSEAFISTASDSGKWMTKENSGLTAAFENAIGESLNRFCGIFAGSPLRKAFRSASIIRQNIFSLGLAGEFHREYDALLKEKNLMSLDESNVLLRDIIDDATAPFIYEKTGVRFSDFLLDEFQDTSNIQWENFRPLLLEGEAGGGYNLIVGDVKQSIYRWRDSDWTLLDSKVKEDLKGAVEITLDSNWRSSEAVVSFNNAFFGYAAEFCDNMDKDGDGRKISEIYAGLTQKKMSSETQEGRVAICHTEDELAKVADIINDAVSRGARPGDICILVRYKADGAAIASFLIENGVNVISDDSLSLKSSLTVRRLVSLLSCLENPDDSVNSYLARSLGIEYPDEYHSLTDLCECLLRRLRAKSDTSGESVFIQAFMDELSEWVQLNGNNLRMFLRHWEEQEIYIGTPEDPSAVRIMTVHKSKGLQFPCVIFPFVEKMDNFRQTLQWCLPEETGTPLDDYLDGIYPVKLGTGIEGTCFEKYLKKERKMQLIDNLNTLYVAFTRAEKELYVIAGPRKKNNPNAFDIVREYVGKECGEYGKPYDYTLMKRPAGKKSVNLDSGYPSYEAGDRMSPSTDACDFFGEEGVGAESSRRRFGIIRHDILSQVNVPGDLDRAVASSLRAGEVTEEQARDCRKMLSTRIAAHPDWFDGKGESFNEVSIFGDDGNVYRPDRVIVRDGAVTVIDYKFGNENPRYVKQVKEYMSLYRKMGAKDVKGYLWYVPEDKVETVV